MADYEATLIEISRVQREFIQRLRERLAAAQEGLCFSTEVYQRVILQQED